MSVRQDLFTHVVNQLNFGATQEELSEKLNECVQRSRETGKSAEITLKITVKPNGSTGQYELRHKIATKIPALDPGATIFFGTPEGNLTRDNPKQEKMDFKTVPAPEHTNYKTI